MAGKQVIYPPSRLLVLVRTNQGYGSVNRPQRGQVTPADGSESIVSHLFVSDKALQN